MTGRRTRQEAEPEIGSKRRPISRLREREVKPAPDAAHHWMSQDSAECGLRDGSAVRAPTMFRRSLPAVAKRLEGGRVQIGLLR